MSRLIVFGLLISLFVGACAPLIPSTSQTVQATPTLSLSAKWTLHMTHSGGIMGLHRTLDITSDGKATIVDERTHKTVTLQLTTDELKQLQGLVAGVTFSVPKTPIGCADCFIYDVTIDHGDAKLFTATVDDMNIEESGMSPLITFLRELMDKALQS